MKDRAFVSVFRSSKKNDTYVFVRRDQKWEDLPEGLRTIFGQPVHSMDLLLTPDKKLARTTGKQVLDEVIVKDTPRARRLTLYSEGSERRLSGQKS